MIKTISEAIAFLEEKRGTFTKDLRDVLFEVYDEDFVDYRSFIKKELRKN